MILSWSPGIILNSAWNTLNSRRCLLLRSEQWERDYENTTYSVLKDSSGSSTRSPVRMRPFMIIEWTLHKACIVRPKCRPWWIRGSEIHLLLINLSENSTDSKSWTYAFLRGPNWRASSRRRRPRTVDEGSVARDISVWVKAEID